MSSRLDSLLQMLEKDPEDSFLLYGIALEYNSVKDYTNAEHYLKKILNSNPDYVPAYMQLAMLMENLNRIEEAKVYYLNGITAAKKTNDAKAAKEMEAFLDELD